MIGVRTRNELLQNALNPVRPVEKFGWQFRLRDKVMQAQNDYDNRRDPVFKPAILSDFQKAAVMWPGETGKRSNGGNASSFNTLRRLMDAPGDGSRDPYQVGYRVSGESLGP